VETLQDRFCLQSNGTRRTPLSAQNLVSCDQNDGGCEGGDLSSAWNYLTTNGVVTAACTPYAFPQCNPTPCLPPFKPTPPCNRVCKDGSDYEKDKHFARNSYSVGGWINRVEDIQREIMTRGPVQAAFTVYQDFITYKSGVYSHVSGQLLGGHAIKIIGWDVINNVPAWLIANSWSNRWGMNGFFYIKRGTDECGIEDDVVAGMVKL
jgi:cathepsin B